MYKLDSKKTGTLYKLCKSHKHIFYSQQDIDNMSNVESDTFLNFKYWLIFHFLRATDFKKFGTSSNKSPEKLKVHIGNTGTSVGPICN